MVKIFVQTSDPARLTELKQLCEALLCVHGYQARLAGWAASPEELLHRIRQEHWKQGLFLMEYCEAPQFEEVLRLVKRSCADSHIVLMYRSKGELLAQLPLSLYASGHLITPVGRKRLEALFDRVERDYWQTRLQAKERFQFKAKRFDYYLSYQDILFFECRSKKIRVKTAEQEFEFYGSLEQISQEAPPYFVRTHRSFLVNLMKISQVDHQRKQIEMEDGSLAFFSRNYKKNLRSVLSRDAWEEKDA